MAHDKRKEQSLSLCIVLNNFIVSNQSTIHGSTLICTPCMHFASVHSWWSQECLRSPSGTWSITTIEVTLRDRKFTYRYCRPHIFNPLTTDDAILCCLTLAICYQLVQFVLKMGFVLAKKVRKGEVGGFQHRVAALAGCRTALVSTGWTISHLVSTNRRKNHSPPLVGNICRTVGSFQSGGTFAGQN